jgi:hypothetical protein
MPAADDTTRSLALHAEEQARDAVGGIRDMRRSLKRVSWVWSALTFIGIVLAAGYALRDRLDHFATKEKVEVNSDDIDRIKSEQREMNAMLRGIIDTQKRTLDGVDDVKRILMNERRR